MWRWKIIIGVEPMEPEGAMGGVPLISRVVNRRVGSRVDPLQQSTRMRRATHSSVQWLPWFVGVHEHNVHGEESCQERG